MFLTPSFNRYLLPPKDYESTVMRIAGNLLSGVPLTPYHDDVDEIDRVCNAVKRARAIVAEVHRTKPPEQADAE